MITAFRLGAALLVVATLARGAEDPRILVDLPKAMQHHMLANMRDHLNALDQILRCIADDDLDRAADIAETRLGMSALSRHGASHMARFMPEAMRAAGQRMHHAASRFARTAEEGDPMAAYRALNDITSACVACHAGFRIR